MILNFSRNVIALRNDGFVIMNIHSKRKYMYVLKKVTKKRLFL